MYVPESLFSYLLSSVDGFTFERVIQKLLTARDGDQFVALGGVKDGGADGFFRSLLEDRSKASSFVQISSEKDTAKKIRETVERLRQFGREVRTLTYWTSRKLNIDVLEDNLSEELDVTIRIRDRDAIFRLVNSSETTKKVFLNDFRREVFELTTARDEALGGDELNVVSDPSVFVFLQHERTERFGKGGLVAPIVDALIYWSLRETDPDSDRLLPRAEVKQRIARLLPSAATTLLPSVDDRLKVLSTKVGGGNQRIRYYRHHDSFCLPHQVRVEIAAASAEEIALTATVRLSLVARAKAQGAAEPEEVATICERATYKHFNEQGLILAAFLEKRLDDVQISDQIVESELQQVAAAGKRLSKSSYVAALRVLQDLFYAPSPEENKFLHKLSRTSLLLFSLKHCPRLIEYFNQMTGKFRLLVGTDILVKALSETFLPEEHRHVTNLLRVAKACGASLLLTKPVVNEIFTHIHGTHLEFKNYYAEQEPYITPQMASQSDRIIIRTYFHAKLLGRGVTGWRSFIEMFMDFDQLAAKTDKGQAQLEAYLRKFFALEAFSLEDSGIHLKEGEVATLASSLEAQGLKNAILAHNDAEMVLSVYALRRKNKEVEKYDGFGLRTWWLTKESVILAHTAALVKSNGGIPYIMRPEFLLNFLSLSPSTAALDPVVRELLPSHVGLQIGQHLPAEHMHKLLTQVDTWKRLPPARREVVVTDAINQLKYDRLKRYETNLDLNGSDEGDALVAALNSAQ